MLYPGRDLCVVDVGAEKEGRPDASDANFEKTVKVVIGT